MPNSNYFKIGIFTLGGLALLLAGLFAFGLGGSLFKKHLYCVTFFDRSVQGLMVDSAVKFRGFNVGKVRSIALDSVEDSQSQPLVEVVFEINPALLTGEDESEDMARRYILDQIDGGLKVFLNFQGITGIGFLDLDYREGPPPQSKHTPLARKADLEGRVFVPNVPGQIMEISESATHIVKSLSEVDFSGISTDLNALVHTVNQSVAQLNTAGISQDLRAALEEIKSAASALNTLTEALDKTVRGSAGHSLSKELEATLNQFRQSLKRLDQTLGSSQANLPLTLDNLRVMSENFRYLSELLKEQPSQLLFGEPPEHISPGSGH